VKIVSSSLICILLFFCAVSMRADVKLDERTKKFYSVPMTPDIDQDAYNRLWKKMIALQIENKKPKDKEYDKAENKLKRLIAKGIKTSEQQREFIRLRKKINGIIQKRINERDPYFICLRELYQDMANVGESTVKRFFADTNGPLDKKVLVSIKEEAIAFKFGKILGEYFLPYFFIFIVLRFVFFRKRKKKKSFEAWNRKLSLVSYFDIFRSKK